MKTIFEAKGITKQYPGVLALDHVDLSFMEGEVLGLVGENGAGKSTLIKSIAGVISIDEGSFFFDGKKAEMENPLTAINMGISVIHQEINIVPSLSVAENIFLGKKLGTKICPDFREMEKQSAEVFRSFGMDIDPQRNAATLTTAQMQIVEIAKAVVSNAKIIIMDEPTATLSNSETEKLFSFVGQLKKSGITIVFVSHRLDEIFEITDRIAIMRDGKLIATRDTAGITREELIRLMVGRELTNTHPPRPDQISGQVVMGAKALSGNGVQNVSFTLHKGEILGFGGLVGAGRTEIAKVICGVAAKESGELLIDGAAKEFRTPYDAIREGIALIPEDRKHEGLFLDYAIDWNIEIMSLKQHSSNGVMQEKELAQESRSYFEKLRVVAPSIKQIVRNLSGGNQQKVVLARVLAAQTKIIIFDEPTVGIDVGAKQEIYQLMNRLTEDGFSIIMISSDMEELLAMSDRILVLHEGRMTGLLLRPEFSQERVLELASGIA